MCGRRLVCAILHSSVPGFPCIQTRMSVPSPASAEEHSSFFANAVQLELAELSQLLTNLDPVQIKTAVAALISSSRIFTMGAGRSGLALQMAAMRLMHLGLQVHVAGEVTTPAIAAGHLLIAASASGTSASVIHAAEVAKKSGAAVLAVTAGNENPLASLADHLILLKAANKNQFGERSSRQYAGSLFEQSVLLLFDAIFHGMWQAGGVPAEALMKRHANLE